MADLKCFTTKEVARLCRVSDATVKRWEDAGLLQSERTSGGHRRFRAEEVIRFQREQCLGLKQSHGDESVIKATARVRDKKNPSDSKANSKDREIIAANYDSIKKGQQKDLMLEPYDIVEVDKSKKSIQQIVFETITGVGRQALGSISSGLSYRIMY